MCVSVLVVYTNKWQNHSDIGIYFCNHSYSSGNWTSAGVPYEITGKAHFPSTFPNLLHVFLSVFPLQCCRWMEEHLQGAQVTLLPPPPPSVLQAPFAQWAREWLGLRGQLCLPSLPSLCMCTVTSKQKVSSKSSGTHSQLSWRESNREEKQGLPQTDTNTNATLSHTETSIPKHRSPSPNAGRGPLDKWGQAWVSERRI